MKKPYVFVLTVIPTNAHLRSRLGKLLQLYLPSFIALVNNPKWLKEWQEAGVDGIMGLARRS